MDNSLEFKNKVLNLQQINNSSFHKKLMKVESYQFCVPLEKVDVHDISTTCYLI